MKNWTCAGLLFIAACANPEAPAGAPPVPPAPNTVVAADSLEHQDALNTFTFAVRLRSTTTRGVYDVLVHDGPKEAAGQFTMPRGAEVFPVRLRRGPGAAFIVGFSSPDDTVFLPYYRIAAAPQTIEMTYTHAYSFK